MSEVLLVSRSSINIKICDCSFSCSVLSVCRLSGLEINGLQTSLVCCVLLQLEQYLGDQLEGFESLDVKDLR